MTIENSTEGTLRNFGTAKIAQDAPTNGSGRGAAQTFIQQESDDVTAVNQQVDDPVARPATNSEGDKDV